VFGTAFLGGLGIDAALGWLVPGYQRFVFFRGRDSDIDPIAGGIGQGITQGVVFGGVVGLTFVGIFYWYRSRAK
jgi:hypothetical protein